jgi:Cu-Zn family superoxide dismutase
MAAHRAPLLALVLAGCAGLAPAPAVDPAAARLLDAAGREVGTAMLTQVGAAVRVVVTVQGLPPGPHAVHVHEVGRCEAPGFDSAGGHFNPHGRQHGALNPLGMHAGDLPNLTVRPDGTGRLEAATEALTLAAGATSVFDPDGSALVVHAGPDDFRTDPAGNSGPRIACGVIERVPPGR